MKLSRLLQRFKMCLTILSVMLILSILAVFVYLHNVGLPDSVKRMVTNELKERHIYATFETLKYKIHRGVVAEGIVLYQNETRENEIFKAQAIDLDLDKTKLVRGVFEIDSATVKQAQVSAPIANNIPNSPLFSLSNINGQFSLSHKGEFETNNGISADFEGIHFIFKGSLFNSSKQKQPKKPLSQEAAQARVDSYNKVLDLIKKIKWSSQSSPTVEIETHGDLAKVNAIELNIKCTSEDLSYNRASVKNLNIQAQYSRKLITITKCEFNDNDGDFFLSGALSLTNNEGEFKVESSINFKKFIDEFSGVSFAKEVAFNGANKIVTEGRITLPHLDASKQPQPFFMHLVGKAELYDVKYLDAEFNYLATEFSYKNNELFLDRLQAFHEDGEFNGRLLMDKHDIKFSSNSSLPPKLFVPFLKGRPELDRVLKQVKLSGSSRINISANGVISRNDITDWQAEGDIYMADISYRDTYISDASLDFILKRNESEYANITANFDHSNWHKQKTFGGSPEGYATADKVRIKKEPFMGFTMIEVLGAEGDLWLTPIVKLFNPKTADMFSTWPLESKVKLAKTNFLFSSKKPIGFSRSKVNLEGFTMAGIDVGKTSLRLYAEPGLTTISNINTKLDYSQYYREKDRVKKTDGAIRIDKVDLFLDRKTREQDIRITGIKGTLWPAAVTKLFAKEAAQSIEDLNISAPVVSKGSSVFLKGKGKEWITKLDLKCGSLAYNHVPIRSGKTIITIDKKGTTFDQTEIDFDFSNYSEKKKFGGPNHGVASAEKITLIDQVTKITNLKGIMWPGQIVSMFSKDSADTIHDLDFTAPLESFGSDLTIDSSEQWSTIAKLNLGAFSYNKVPLKSAKLNMELNEQTGLFTGVTAQFDHRSYNTKLKYGGPSSSQLTVDKLSVNFDKELVTLGTLKGNFWPAPALRMFSPEVADELEEFRFKRPPYSSTTGVIDLKNNSTKTHLKTRIKSNGAIVYNFLDEDVTINSASAHILTTSKVVKVTDIKAELFATKYNKTTKKFPLEGRVDYYYSRKKPYFDGAIAWNKLSIKSIGKTYKKEKQLDTGLVSGGLKFTATAAGAAGFNGKGSFFIEEGNLAQLPFIGRIKAATADYTVKNGVMSTNNLKAYSNSSMFTGKGTVNLNNDRVDLRIKLAKLKRFMKWLNLPRKIFNEFPILDGAVKYKLYGQMDKLKVRPDPGGGS